MEPHTFALVQAIASTSTSFRNAVFDWWHGLAPSTLAQWAGALMTFLVVSTALFKDSFLLWRRRPCLSAKCTLDSPWTVRTTIQVLQATERPNVVNILRAGPCYYIRTEVTNGGKTRAEKVQVFASKLARLSEGKFEDVSDFIPLNLKWANSPPIGASAVLDGISPKMSAFCDVVSVCDPQNSHQRRPQGAAPGVAIAQLQLEVEPTNERHLLPPGTYKLSLRIAAANVKPVDKILEFRHDGWSQDDAQMKHDLLRVSLK